MNRVIGALFLLTLSTPTLAEDRDGRGARDERGAPAESDDVRVPVESLPEVCREAVLAAWPGAEIRKVEQDEGDYEVGIRDAHGHMLELRVSADGRLLNQDRELERERARGARERHERDEDHEEDDD